MDSFADILSEHGIPEDVAILYDHYMERLEACLEKKNIEKFMEIFEDFVKELFVNMMEAKDVILQRQATSLLDLRQKMGELIDQQI